MIQNAKISLVLKIKSKTIILIFPEQNPHVFTFIQFWICEQLKLNRKPQIKKNTDHRAKFLKEGVRKFYFGAVAQVLVE